QSSEGCKRRGRKRLLSKVIGRSSSTIQAASVPRGDRARSLKAAKTRPTVGRKSGSVIVLACIGLASVSTIGSGSLLRAASRFGGFISFQASRYCSNEERFEPSVTQMEARRST